MERGPGSSPVRTILSVTLAALLLGAATASGATLVVNTTTDDVTPHDGLCSLRKAVASVDTPGTPSPDCATPSATGNTIVLGATGSTGATGPVVYALTIKPTGPDDNTTGDLDIAAGVSNLTIEGPAAGAATIDASGLSDRALSIAAGASVTITGVTISGGHAPNGPPDLNSDGATGAAGAVGGGILNAGTLTVTSATISGNSAGNGGSAGFATMTIRGGLGGAGGAGGGIFNTGSLTLTGVTITGNHAGAAGTGGVSTTIFEPAGASGAGGGGGGIASSGDVTVTDSTISGNFAGDGAGGGDGLSGATPGNGGPGGSGGGILSTAAGLTVAGSTITTNHAGAGGNGPMAMSDGTDAPAGGAGGCGGDGGGIDAASPTPSTIISSTFSGNQAGAGGSGGFGAIAPMFGGAGGAGCAGGSGGGLANAYTTTTIANSTFTANFAGPGGAGGSGGLAAGGGGEGGGGGAGGAGGSGGGIVITGAGQSTMLAATDFENGIGAPGAGGAGGLGESGGVTGATGTAGPSGSGGGVATEIPGKFCLFPIGCPRIAITDSIDASNAGSNCFGDQIDGGDDLSFGDTTCPGGNGDPKLGPLRDNGGPAPTSDLGPGSAAIDGVPATGAGCPATDERGLPRPSGTACDIGAFELTPPAATTGAATAVTATTATVSGTATANQSAATTAFDTGTSTQYGTQATAQGVTGLTGASVSANLTGLTPSTTYHFRLTVVSPDGTAHGADATFTTLASAGGGGGGSQGGGSNGGGSNGGGSNGGGAGSSAPKLTALKLAPAVFAAAGSGASIARTHGTKKRTGTTVSYTDSEGATTTLTVAREAAGVRSGSACVAPPRRRKSGAKPKACTRLVVAGHFTHADTAGPNRFHCTGRVGSHALRAGRYELTAVPAAGSSTGAPATAHFRITG